LIFDDYIEREKFSMAYFVFRINYDDNFNLIRNELLVHNRLRQGWGTYEMRADQGFETYKLGWQKHWEKDLPDEHMRARYNIISIMNNIIPGDYLIIPKISVENDYVCRSFIIAKCKLGYQFSVLNEVEDFGHYIEVENVFSCSYDKNIHSQAISSKFCAYQSAINTVKNQEFIKAVDELVSMHDSEPVLFEKESIDLLDMVSSATHDERKNYLESIVNALRNLKNHKFEDIISELFRKNGYSAVGNNWYDREGGDVDIVFEAFNENTLMHNIYEICEIEKPHIYVQAKKKTGTDFEDVVGVEQLIQMESIIPEKNAILIVINLTDQFTKDAREKAQENGIILIDGITFASLLVRYGIEVDIV